MQTPCVALSCPLSISAGEHSLHRVILHRHRVVPSARSSTKYFDARASNKDPRRDVFFPANIYRPEEVMAKLCKRKELPEELGNALVKAVEAGKFPFHEQKLAGAVEKARGIIELLTPEVAVPLMIRYPILLRNTPERLQERLSFICQLLGCDMHDALSMARRYPPLLNVKARRVQWHYNELQATFVDKFNAADLSAMVRITPAMLCMQPASLRSKWHLLQQRAALHPPWQCSLGSTTPGAVATLLTYSPRRIDRLRYLHETGQANIALVSVVMKPDAWFEQQYPGWIDWATSRQSMYSAGRQKSSREDTE